MIIDLIDLYVTMRIKLQFDVTQLKKQTHCGTRPVS